MGESYGRNGATILASGRYRLDWLGATYSGSGQYIGSSDVVATSWDRRGIYCAANSQSAFFNFCEWTAGYDADLGRSHPRRDRVHFSIVGSFWSTHRSRSNAPTGQHTLEVIQYISQVNPA